MFGFDNLKDIAEILIIPFVGFALPRLFEGRKRIAFMSLIKK